MSDPPSPTLEGDAPDDGLFTISASGLTATEIDSLRAWKKNMDARRTMDGKEVAEINVFEGSPARARRSKSANPRQMDLGLEEAPKHSRRNAHSISANRSRHGTTGDLAEVLRASRPQYSVPVTVWPDEGQPLRMSARAREESDPGVGSLSEKRIQPRVARRLELSADPHPRRETRTSSPHLRKDRVFSADDNFPLRDGTARGERKFSSQSPRTLMSPARSFTSLGGLTERGIPVGPERLERSHTMHERKSSERWNEKNSFERSDKSSFERSDKNSFERADGITSNKSTRFLSPERGEGVPFSDATIAAVSAVHFSSPDKNHMEKSTTVFTPDRSTFSHGERGGGGLFSPSTPRAYSPSSSRFSDRGLFVDPENMHPSPNPIRRAMIDDVWQQGGPSKQAIDGPFALSVDTKDRRGPSQLRARDSPKDAALEREAGWRDNPEIELPLLPPARSLSRGVTPPLSNTLSPMNHSNKEPVFLGTVGRQGSSRLQSHDSLSGEGEERKASKSNSRRALMTVAPLTRTPPSSKRSLNTRPTVPPSPPDSPRGSQTMEDEPLTRAFGKRLDETEYAVPPSRELDIEYFNGNNPANPNNNNNNNNINNNITTTEEFSENRKRRRPDSQVEYFNKESGTPSSTLDKPSSSRFSPGNFGAISQFPLTPPHFSPTFSDTLPKSQQRKGALSPLESYSPGVTAAPFFVGILRHEVSVISFVRAHSWQGIFLALLSLYWLATCLASAWKSAIWIPSNRFGEVTWSPAVTCFLWSLLALCGILFLGYTFLGWRSRMPILCLERKEKCMSDLVRDVHDDVAGSQSELALNYLEARINEKAAVLSSRSDWDVDLAPDLRELLYRLEPREQFISYNLFMQFLTDLSPSRLPRFAILNVNHSQFHNVRGLLYIGMAVLLSFCLMLTCQLPLDRVITFQIILALVCLCALCSISRSFPFLLLQCIIVLVAGTFPLVDIGEENERGNCDNNDSHSVSASFSLKPFDILQVGFVPHVVSLLLLCALSQLNTQHNVRQFLSDRKQAISESLGSRLQNVALTSPTKQHIWRGPLVAIFVLAVAWGICIVIVVISQLWFGPCAMVPACTEPRFLCGFDIWHTCTCFDSELCLSNRSLTSIPDLQAWKHLNYLDISNNYIVDLPSYLCTFSDLSLVASSNLIQSLPVCLGTLGPLYALNLSYNDLRSFPSTNMIELASLDLSHNRLHNLTLHSPTLLTLALPLNQVSHLELDTPALVSLDISRNPVGTVLGLEQLTSLTYFKASHSELLDLPADFYSLVRLKECDLSNNHLTKLPNPTTKFGTPAMLKFNLAGNQLKELPDSLANTGWYKSLQELDLSSNALTGLPATLGDFSVLRYLSLQNNMLQALAPSVLQGLSSLQTLLLSFNVLARLPSQISRMSALTRLEVARNLLETIPFAMGNLSELRYLSLASNALSSLPTGLAWPLMESLDLSRNKLGTDDLGFISTMSHLQILNLRENMISTWVNSLSSLNKLTQLDLSKNFIEMLPESISGLNQLQQLDLSSNLLASLPQSLSDLEFLTQLKLANNKITSDLVEATPANASTRVWCPLLQQLDLSSNLLTTCSAEVRNLRQLEILDVSFNPIRGFPVWLPDLTSLLRFRAAGLNVSSAKNVTMLPRCGDQLMDLDISSNGIAELDDGFTSTCSGLHTLDASANLLQLLPDSFANFTSLTTLHLFSNPLCRNQYGNWAPSGIKLILDSTDACGV